MYVNRDEELLNMPQFLFESILSTLSRVKIY